VMVDGSAKGGLNFSFHLQSRSQLTFWTRDLIGVYSPVYGQTIQVYQDGTTLTFNGYVDTIMQQVETGTTILFVQVQCLDFGVILDRRAVYAYLASFAAHSTGGTLGGTVAEIWKASLSDTGISVPNSTEMSEPVGDWKFYGVTCTEAFNQLATRANVAWVVTAAKELRFFYQDTGWSAASVSFTNAQKNWITMQLTYSKRRFANRVLAKSSANLGALWTDTEVAGPLNLNGMVLLTSYPVPSVPSVTVNGVSQVVIESAQFTGPGAFDFYYFQGSLGVFRNPYKAAFSPGDIIEATYPSPLPFIGIAADNASIAAVGRVDEIVEGGNILDPEDLTDLAEQELLRAKVDVPTQIKLWTRAGAPLQLGQLMTVNTTNPTVNQTFIITSIIWKEIGADWIEYEVSGANAAYQRLSNPARFLGDLILRSRTPINTVVEHISFVVAGTIEGLTNPGLTNGAKEAIAVSQKDGIAGWVTLTFKSGLPATSDIIIDIFADGNTIFGSQKMVIPAGAVDAAQYVFALTPLKITPGIHFTYEVLAGANAAIKDGFMDLVVLG
jgi:hypothetical protein